MARARCGPRCLDRYRRGIESDDAEDDQLRRAGIALAAAIEAALVPWVVACVEQRSSEAFGQVAPELIESGAAAGVAAAREVGERLRALLERDVDEQTSTPLSIVREAVRFPTEVLRDARVPAVARDPFSARRFPDDDYSLTPTSLAALGREVGDLAIAWGAAKAAAHRRRHRR